MPRRKLSKEEQAAREAEILQAPPDMSNKTIQALMSPEFERMSNLDASQIALLLQELVRGQNSLLADARNNALEIAKIRERQDQIDHEIATSLAEQKKFVEEVLDQAEKIRRTGMENDKLIANGVAMYEAARQEAVAKRAVKNMQLREKFNKEEKVMIVSPGQLVTTMEGGQQVAKIIAEEVHIADMHWVLPPGVPVNVPKSVAEVLNQRRASQRETARRQELLSKNMESSKLAEEWNKIEGTTSPMPT